MKKNKGLKIVGVIFLCVIVLGLVLSRSVSYDAVTLIKSAPVGTGYTAKILCSAVFLSGRDPEAIWNEDLELMRKNMIGGRVNFEDKSTEAYILGMFYKRKAVYRENCGCSIVIGVDEEKLRNECDVELPALPESEKEKPWPLGDAVQNDALPDGVDAKQISDTLDWAFDDSVRELPVRTRAVVVVYDGQIVAERYADGFNQDTRLIGWSMSKSVTSALIGILVRDGKLNLMDRAPVPEWANADDPRNKITLDQLLRMSSGLEWREEYEEDPDTDVGYMMFTDHDAAAYAANKKLEADPDTKFNYSSGTTMILSRIIRETVGGDYKDYLEFPKRELFNKLGMRSALIEPDPSGVMMGAGWMYATARDWTRFGLLYYNDGVWNGEQILPEGWVEYTRTPSSTDQQYGGQFWLNKGGKDSFMPDCPDDMYMAWGHESQLVTIIPSRKMVVVRMGQTPDGSKWDHNYFVSHLLKAFPE